MTKTIIIIIIMFSRICAFKMPLYYKIPGLGLIVRSLHIMWEKNVVLRMHFMEVGSSLFPCCVPGIGLEDDLT